MGRPPGGRLFDASTAPRRRGSGTIGPSSEGRMRRILTLLAFASVVLGPAAFAGPASHTGIVKTKRFEVRYRPGSRAAADADRQAVAAERDLDRIAAALETTPKGPFTLWIYDDVDELHLATGAEGCAGFSSS